MSAFTCIYILGAVIMGSYGLATPMKEETNAEFLRGFVLAIIFAVFWPLALGCILSKIRHR